MRLGLSFCIIVLLAALAAPPAALAEKPAKPAAKPASPSWANDPAVVDQLQTTVAAFFGDARGDYDAAPAAPPEDPKADPALVVTQFRAAFFGVPVGNAPKVLPDGKKLYVGCKPHDCMVRAALVTEADGATPVAAALKHHYCGRTFPGSTEPGRPTEPHQCEDAATLTLFFPKEPPMDIDVEHALVSWAQSELPLDALAKKAQGEKLKVETRILTP
jgi:hypothetical protein